MKQCAICYKNIRFLNQTFTNKCSCKITYCSECIMKWVEKENSCPTCRKQLYTNKSIKHIRKIFTRDDYPIRDRKLLINFVNFIEKTTNSKTYTTKTAFYSNYQMR